MNCTFRKIKSLERYPTELISKNVLEGLLEWDVVEGRDDVSRLVVLEEDAVVLGVGGATLDDAEHACRAAVGPGCDQVPDLVVTHPTGLRTGTDEECGGDFWQKKPHRCNAKAWAKAGSRLLVQCGNTTNVTKIRRQVLHASLLGLGVLYVA